MELELAESAGFCFGVKRAITIIYNALDQNKKICTLGNIIHNQNMIDELQKKGTRVITSIDQSKDDETIVIRSHGVSQDIYNKLNLLKKNFLDGTCPFVAKIHKIVSGDFIDNKTNNIINKNNILVIIIGDKNHPEIKGIEGHCIYKFITIADSKNLEEYLKQNNIKNKYIKVVSQTTYNPEKFKLCVDILKNNLDNFEIFDTICSETKKRQSEAESMSKTKDLMIVVGDKNSSNTQKLFNVCNKNCKTIFIESSKDLEDLKNLNNIKKYKNIGVTAGASTPENIIEAVMDNLKNINNIDQDNNFDFDFDFEKELEKEFEKESKNSLFVGAQVKGTVIKLNKNEAQIDIGNQYDAYLPLSQITNNKNLKINDIIKIGDELDLKVIKINDRDGLITLSKKNIDKKNLYNKLKQAYDENLVVEGVVTKIRNDGVIVSVCDNLSNISGVEVYINRSQISENEDEFKNLLGQKVNFKITHIDLNKKRFKGSIKQIKNEIFWSKIKVGDKLKGRVNGLTDFGAFVDLDGEDGLIFIADLAWHKIKHASEVLKIGQIVDVTVKHLDFEKKRVALYYKTLETNPWEIIKNNYKDGDSIDVKIVSITPFGAFAQIIPGVEGLLHISEISDQYVKSVSDFVKVGQQISVKIKEINLDKKKILLSLKDPEKNTDI